MSKVFYIVLERNNGKQLEIGSFDNEMQAMAFMCDIETIIKMVKSNDDEFAEEGSHSIHQEIVPKQPAVKEEDKIKRGNKIVPFKKKLYYLYNFDTDEGLQFGKYEGFIAYLNDHNSSVTIYNDKKQWLKTIKDGEEYDGKGGD